MQDVEPIDVIKPAKPTKGEQPEDDKPYQTFPKELFAPFHVMSVDLMDWNNLKPYNSGIAYGFIAVDVFTRYVWAIPIKSKDQDTMLESFKEIFKQAGKVPRRVWVDHESGIYSKKCRAYLESLNVDLYTTYGAAGSVYAENEY